MFDCTSYPGSNLGDFSGLFSDALNPEGIPVWQQLGFPDKAAWKQAGRPTSGATVTVTPEAAAAAGANAGATTSESSSGGGLFGSIPSSYLMIGAVVVVLMVLKK